MFAAVALAASSFRSTHTTLAPSLANNRQACWPMPLQQARRGSGWLVVDTADRGGWAQACYLPAPVTRATFVSRRPGMMLLMLVAKCRSRAKKNDRLGLLHSRKEVLVSLDVPSVLTMASVFDNYKNISPRKRLVFGFVLYVHPPPLYCPYASSPDCINITVQQVGRSFGRRIHHLASS